MRRFARVSALLGLGALAACQLKLPAAPSELTEGIVIFQDADYLGASAHVTKDIANLMDYAGPCNNQDLEIKTWGDCISSIRVAPGWRATIFERTDYRGEFLNVVEDTPNLVLVNGTCRKGGLNDCIRSVRVSRP